MDPLTTPKTLPRAKKNPRRKAVSIRLDPTIHEQVEQLARADKRSFSQFVELILERYLRSTPLETEVSLGQAFTNTQHGFWSQFNAYEAAANLQNMLKES